MDVAAQKAVNEIISAENNAKEAAKLSTKQENAEFAEKIRPFTEKAKEIKTKISEKIKSGINDLVKLKPTTWREVLDFWEVRLKELNKVIVSDNVSFFDDHIINTSGFYYAGEIKNGELVLKNLYGAPGVGYRASYAKSAADYYITASYKWVEDGYPSTDYHFLTPSTIISCNGGRIGIFSSGISIPAGVNWHFSTNNGKNANGTISLKTDGIFIASRNATRFNVLYTFK